MNAEHMTVQQALALADQACPLPSLGGQALRVLRAHVQLLEAEVAAHHGKAASKPTSGVARIAAERTRQILAEGWSTAHDRQHGAGELVSAACVYAMATLETGVPPIAVMNLWPWARTWWKPGTPVRNLEKAGALIAAEIDRLTLTDEATP